MKSLNKGLNLRFSTFNLPKISVGFKFLLIYNDSLIFSFAHKGTHFPLQ